MEYVDSLTWPYLLGKGSGITPYTTNNHYTLLNNNNKSTCLAHYSSAVTAFNRTGSGGKFSEGVKSPFQTLDTKCVSIPLQD